MKSIISLVFFFISQSCYADIIKYTDSRGKTFFVDSMDKVPQEYKSQVENLNDKSTVSRISPNRKQLYQKSHYEELDTVGSGKLEIFVADWCGYCQALEADLKTAHIPYTRYNIETSKIGQKVYKELGGGGIPISRIGKTIIRGYSSLDQIKKALALK